MLNILINKLKIYQFRKKWRKINKHNFTIAKIKFDTSIVSVGNFSYGKIDVHSINKKNKLLIGNYCSIAENVKFLLGVEHPLNFVSTYPFKAFFLNGVDAISKGDIIIKDDVWLGTNSTILSGVEIGQGAVVAAGAVVTKDVPPYAIVGGVPAKIIKYRFNEEIIEKLLKLDYSKLNSEIVKKNIDLFYNQMTDETADKMIEIFGKFEGE
ncbi:MAG: CatB-related O-acetyltransferase [Clostridia bacterium]|nr:CatB-related O-acetyltransferase [Clostridia bacterium]